MEWSNYNKMIRTTDGYSYLFNAFTKQWVKMESSLGKLIDKYTSFPDGLQAVHPDLFGALKENAFLVDDVEKEMYDCLKSIQEKLNDSSVWKLTINPTLDCNLRCWYCYESHLKGSAMSDDTINKIEMLISNTLKTGNVQVLQLAFFGGEPLLKYSSVVLPILISAKEVCKRNNVKLFLSFTSNSVCLTKKVVDKLKSICDDIAVQVPFDGGKTYHNEVKHFENGRGSYDIVRRNIIYAIEQGIRINIRCNYTFKSLMSFEEVVRDFSDYHHYPNLRFSFHKVWQEKESLELKERMIEFKNAVMCFQFKSNLSSHFGDSVNPCYGDYTQNIVVNYNGDVFKCTARDFESEHRVGVLESNGTIAFSEKNNQRLSRRFTKDCAKCKRLPICPICSQVRSESSNGGCPIQISEGDVGINIAKYFYDLTGIMYVK